MRLLAGFFFGLISLPLIGAAPFFEPLENGFVANVETGQVRIHRAEIQLWRATGETPDRLRWIGGSGELHGAAPTGGVTNYVLGSEPAQWRIGVPRYARVETRELYPGIDLSYYISGGRLEFDLDVAQGADPSAARFGFDGGARVSLNRDGDLVVRTETHEYRYHRPRAYQGSDGDRHDVECSYRIYGDGSVGFTLGSYDRTQALVIDPVIDFATYYGGNLTDHLLGVTADSVGNVIVAGSTSSTNFPGLPLGSNASAFFVSKLNSAGTAVVFTTVIQTPSVGDGSVQAMTSDASGVYLTGIVNPTGFPLSANAYSKTGSSHYVMKLNFNGEILYSTFLGQTGGTPLAIQVRNGNAYIAGRTSTGYLGTPGAYQREIAGTTEGFVTVVNAGGTGLLFSSAIGGSLVDNLTSMALDGMGNVVVVGTTQSTNFPVTTGAGLSGTTAGFIARLSANGSALIYSRLITGASPISATSTPDGNVVVAGSGVLPGDLTAAAIKNKFAVGTSTGWLLKIDASNNVLWSTESGASGSGLTSDGAGNLYYTSPPYLPSGGAIQSVISSRSYGLQKVSSDGARLLYGTSFPDPPSSGFGLPSSSPYRTPTVARIAVDPTGIVWVAGYSGGIWPTTPGVLQPSLDPAAPGTQTSPKNNDDGFVARFDLRDFSQGNYFAPTFLATIEWRKGTPLPAPMDLPIQIYGTPFNVTAIVPPGITASFRENPSRISVNIDPAAVQEGSTSNPMALSAPSIPNSNLTVNVGVRVLPPITFTLGQTDVEIRRRVGQTFEPMYLPLTSAHTGFEAVSSDTQWLYPYYDSTRKAIFLNVGQKPVGTYEAIITVSATGELTSGVPKQTIRVRYIVEGAATISVSATAVQLHVVGNQPSPTAKLQVTSSIPGVKFGVFVGVSRTWLSVKTTSTTTPGEIVITADSAAATPGIYGFNMSVTGEDGKQIIVTINVDVSSGAPLDVDKTSIEYTFDRGWTSGQPAQIVTVNTPTPQPVTWSIDQTWTSLAPSGSGTTPFALGFIFNTTSLKEGTYKATLTIQAGSNIAKIPITYTVYDAIVLNYPTTPLKFRYQIGSAVPPAQTFQITTAQSRNPALGVSANGAIGAPPNLISITPRNVSTPATISVAIDPTGATPGTYSTEIWVQSYSVGVAGNGSLPRIPISVEIVPDPNAPTNNPQKTISGMTNGASYLAGVVSPGEIVTLFGENLAADPLAVAQPDSTGKFVTTFGQTRVLFDDIPAPVIYTSAKQIAVVAPFGLAGKTRTAVIVETAGVRTAPLSVNVARSNPGLFTFNSQGSGILAAYNVATSGVATLHTASNPIDKGGVLTLFGSGFGGMTPAVPDGAAVNAPLPKLLESVRVLVGGKEAEVLYSGPAPTYIAGLMQINIRVPYDVATGTQQLIVIVGDAVSQPGVTVSVK